MFSLAKHLFLILNDCFNPSLSLFVLCFDFMSRVSRVLCCALDIPNCVVRYLVCSHHCDRHVPVVAQGAGALGRPIMYVVLRSSNGPRTPNYSGFSKSVRALAVAHTPCAS